MHQSVEKTEKPLWDKSADLLYCSKSVLLQHFPSSQPPSQFQAFALPFEHREVWGR